MLSRLKFEYEPLAELLLNQIPEDIWQSSNTTFFDPCLGGGQFVKVIEQKLRSYGHDDDNIQQRIFGFEDNMLRINYAVNKNKLLGNFTHGNALEQATPKKYDVVVCNPPFDSPNKVSENRKQPQNHNLWTQYVTKSFKEFVKDEGYVCFTTPDSWMSPTNEVYALFNEYNLLWAKADCKKYFPNVGTSSTAWVAKKSSGDVQTDFGSAKINLKEWPYLPRDLEKSLSVHKKVLSYKVNRLNAVGDNKCHSSKDVVSATQDAVFKYPLQHTNAQQRYGSVKSTYFDEHKVYWTTSGNYIPRIDNGSIGFTEPNQAVIVNSEQEAQAVFSFMNSKLYYYIVTTAKWSGFLNGKVFKLLPDLGREKIWSDEQLFALFDISDQEQKYINEYFKKKTVDNID